MEPLRRRSQEALVPPAEEPVAQKDEAATRRGKTWRPHLPGCLDLGQKHRVQFRFVPVTCDRRPTFHQPEHPRVPGKLLEGVEAVDDLAHQVAHGVVIEVRYLGPRYAPSVCVDDRHIGVVAGARDRDNTGVEVIELRVAYAEHRHRLGDFGLTAIANGESRIDVSWVAPVQTGGRPISGYKIEVYDETAERWTTLVASQEAIAYSDTGLSPGTARHCRVSAITAAGTSKPSETASATTPVHAHCTSGTGGDFWCAVLVVKDLGFAARGCHDEANKECSDTSVLTDGALAYNDSSHEIRSISVNSFRLRVELEDAFPSDSDGWALHVGSAAFDVADADKVSMKIRGWSNPGLSWSVGDTVPLRLGASVTHPASGMPTISGRTQVGETLTANRGSLVDADGMPATFPDDFAIQWVRVDGTTETDVAGETSSTYPVAPADAGKRLKMRVSFTDGAENEESRTSDASAIVTAAPPTPTHCVTGNRWCATLMVGEVTRSGAKVGLGFNAGANEGALSHDRFRFNGTPFEVAELYLDTASDPALVLKLAPPGASTFEGNKAMLHVGSTDFSFTDAVLSSSAFQWATSGLSWSVGDTVELRLLGNDNTAATGKPTISGTARVVETLTASTSGISDANGLASATFTYQWHVRCAVERHRPSAGANPARQTVAPAGSNRSG